TGEPITHYKIIPGYKPPVTATAPPPKPMLQKILEPLAHKTKVIPWNERIFWRYPQVETNTTANFAMDFIPLSCTPVLRVEAAGKDGRFNFAARPEGYALLVAHAAGWAEESVVHGGEDLKLRLQPWASLKGVLVDANGAPMPGVPLGLEFPNDYNRGEPHLH